MIAALTEPSGHISSVLIKIFLLGIDRIVHNLNGWLPISARHLVLAQDLRDWHLGILRSRCTYELLYRPMIGLSFVLSERILCSLEVHTLSRSS